jgi:hypothetical protein
MYTRLYDAMVAWYMRPYSAGPYVHMYAVLSLSLMAFLNTGSIIVLCAHWHAAWAMSILAIPRPIGTALLAAALIAVHLLFSKRRRQLASPGKNIHSQSRWIAPVYMITSVIVFIYISGLISETQHY